ncbi:CvpA family protein [Persicobacter psychrovividus]|uniref:CvpA family protein n=1 Tax=Persicobacter psychrovividus TaxID=387638 RepID=A0ABM7VAS3_9BACT|nr:hypothetical protein PEPS_02960 [Persicobacter psychrovividus]
MAIFDICVILLIGYGAYNGFKKGLIVSIVTTFSLFIALWGAVKFQEPATKILSPLINTDPHLTPYLVFILLFIAFVVGVHLIGTLLKKFVNMTLLGSLDTFAGGILGVLKNAAFVTVLVFGMTKIAPEMAERLSKDSVSFPYFEKAVKEVAKVVPAIDFKVPDIKKMV